MTVRRENDPAQADLLYLDHILSGIEARLAELCDQRSTLSVDTLSALVIARAIYARRRRRDRIFAGLVIFGEPSWDVLLDLFIAHETGASISVSSASLASASPPTTGLRHIDALQDRGLVERRPDPDDGRRIWLCLTRRGHDLMLACLSPGASPCRSHDAPDRMI